MRMPRETRGLRLMATTALLAGCWNAAVWAQEPLTISAPLLVVGDGRVVHDASITLRDGKISSVGPRDEVDSQGTVIAYRNAVIFPGLVDAGTFRGGHRDRDDKVSPLRPHVHMADVVDSRDPRLREALSLGITTFHLVPGDTAVVAGRTAVLKVDAVGAVRFLKRQGSLKINLDESSYLRDRMPTSLMGAMDLLRSEREALVPARDGAWVTAPTRREVDVATGIRALLPHPFVLVTEAESSEHAALLHSQVRGIVLKSFLPELNDLRRRAAAEFSAAGLSPAFATWDLPAAALRLSLVTARRGGLGENDAWAAVTLAPAKLLGVEDRVGSLEPKKDADVVVFSHDPTDPRARVLLVVQDGRVVHRVDQPE